jgi:hypothetical protein
VPTTRKPVPTAKTTKPVKTVKPTMSQLPVCPNQMPFFHDWCVRHGFQPPQG